MKKIHTTMIVGLMAGMVMLAGCKREYGTVTLGANIDNGRDAKVYIDNLTPCWHNNDLIRVNNQTCTTSAALGSSAQITDVVESNHYRAIYPADIVGDVDISSSSTIAVTLPHEQIYEVDSRGDQKVKVPMGAYSSNERLTFHNLCSVIKIVVSNSMDEPFILDRILVTANNAYLSGMGNVTITGNASDGISMVASSASHEVLLNFTNSSRPVINNGDRDSYVYYIIVPEFTENAVTITLYSQGRYATFEKSGVSLGHNKIAITSLTVNQLTEGVPEALYGLFTINESGDQIYFSKGNLQHNLNTDTWRFAEHQYDYVGEANSNTHFAYNGWRDLLINSGAYIHGLQTLGYYDNAHPWRMLLQSEWAYLLNSRSGASTKWGTGNVNGVGGMIILPDDWIQPIGCTFYSGGSSSHDWTQNSYTILQWTIMESAGAVFLPAAGSSEMQVDNHSYTYYNNIINVGVVGFYWAGSTDFYYRYLSFSGGGFTSTDYTPYTRCGSIRLVRDNI